MVAVQPQGLDKLKDNNSQLYTMPTAALPAIPPMYIKEAMLLPAYYTRSVPSIDSSERGASTAIVQCLHGSQPRGMFSQKIGKLRAFAFAAMYRFFNNSIIS